ncbi:hypothetical protein [Altererythrobacter sp. Root672]|uniref:hypothetical protein n=1 Tax=Altererythrobacter sp. Root672 TaxID=1736584 RepID=UPI000A448650|nr:hypothetical protein [Altererythrobacter sp. Root672]
MNSKDEVQLAEMEIIEAPKIKLTLVPRYAVGGYTNTNLARAIVEAKRARRRGQSR